MSDVVAELNRIKLERDRSLMLIAVEAAKEWDESLRERNPDGTFKTKGGGSSSAADKSSAASDPSGKFDLKSMRSQLDTAMGKLGAEIEKDQDKLAAKAGEIQKAISSNVARAIARASSSMAKARESMPKDVKDACEAASKKASEAISALAKGVEVSAKGLKDFAKNVSNVAGDLLRTQTHSDVVSLEILLIGNIAAFATITAVAASMGYAPTVYAQLLALGVVGKIAIKTEDKLIDAYIEERNKRLTGQLNSRTGS